MEVITLIIVKIEFNVKKKMGQRDLIKGTIDEEVIFIINMKYKLLQVYINNF